MEHPMEYYAPVTSSLVEYSDPHVRHLIGIQMMLALIITRSQAGRYYERVDKNSRVSFSSARVITSIDPVQVTPSDLVYS